MIPFAWSPPPIKAPRPAAKTARVAGYGSVELTGEYRRDARDGLQVRIRWAGRGAEQDAWVTLDLVEVPCAEAREFMDRARRGW